MIHIKRFNESVNETGLVITAYNRYSGMKSVFSLDNPVAEGGDRQRSLNDYNMSGYSDVSDIEYDQTMTTPIVFKTRTEVNSILRHLKAGYKDHDMGFSIKQINLYLDEYGDYLLLDGMDI